MYCNSQQNEAVKRPQLKDVENKEKFYVSDQRRTVAANQNSDSDVCVRADVGMFVDSTLVWWGEDETLKEYSTKTKQKKLQKTKCKFTPVTMQNSSMFIVESGPLPSNTLN